MKSAHKGYIAGYLGKEADIAAGVGEAVGEFGGAGVGAAKDVLVDWVIPVALAAPGVAGLALGLAHSRATSPSKLDEESIQKRMELNELEQAVAELKRRREHALNESGRRRIQGAGTERSIRL
jgi:hypothetical protein